MAINKQEHFKGYTAEYWRIKSISKINIEEKRVEFYIHQFKDEETRRKSLDNELIVSKDEVQIENIDGNIREQIYKQLMLTKEFFKDSKACQNKRMNKDLDKLLQGGGLRELPKDERDFRLGSVIDYGDPVEEDFDVIDKKFLKAMDQKNTDFCTAYAIVHSSRAQEEIDLSPEFQFGVTKIIDKMPQSWGANIRDACKAVTTYGSITQEEWDKVFGVKGRYNRDVVVNADAYPKEWFKSAQKYRKGSYFQVTSDKGDVFDNIRSALWYFRDKKQAVITGCLWEKDWNEDEDGIIDTTGGKIAGGHAIAIVGQKIINGKIYLKVMNSYGPDFGLKGFAYFSREVVNEKLAPYGYFMIVDIEKEVAQILIEKKWKLSTFTKLIAKITALLTKILK